MADIWGLMDLYFPEQNGEKFSSQKEQQDAWVSFVDLLSSLLYEELKDGQLSAFSRVGSSFSDAQTQELLAPPTIGCDRDDVYNVQIEDIFNLLIEKGRSDDGTPLFPLSKVLDNDLSRIECFAVIVAFVSSMSRKYEAVFSTLADEQSSDGNVVTVGLIADMGRFFLMEEDADLTPLISPDSFVNRCVFKKSDRAKEGMAANLILNQVVLSYLEGGHPVLSELISYAKLTLPDDEKKHICLTDTYDEICAVMKKSRLMELSGREGSGRRFLIGRALSDAGKWMLTIDIKLLSEHSSDAVLDGCIGEIIFLSRVCDCAPYLWCQGDINSYSGTIRQIFFRLKDTVNFLCIGSEKPLSQSVLGGTDEAIYRIAVPETTSHDQATLWLEAAKDMGLSFAKDYSINVLVSKYVMSPGRIFEVMNNVSAIMGIKNKKNVIDTAILEEQIRRSCSVQFGENATRIASHFTWDDLMLKPDSEELLRMASDRVRFRSTVNEDFGFAKKLPYGKGVAIVFYGPPGTGKTMAAQVLANELGLDIYRIDLSQISSKYIGETEKNLGSVFEAAKNSNAILFFDEADSLFSKRTEVSSSNDKYANAETSYLLQKIEEYTGVSVLATNNMQNFDAAFRRRMTFLIPIEPPDENTRIRLWEAVFPEDTPIDKKVDLKIVAKNAELTGSSIKSAAVTASYLAAAKGRPVSWEDIIRAIDLEGAKAGKLGLGSRLREAMLTGI